MRRIWVTVVTASIGLAGSGNLAGAELFSATRMVVAIMAGDLYVGEAEGRLSGAGTLTIHAQKDPALTCSGQFTSSAELGGAGQLRCSDGANATFRFKRLTVFRGYGDGDFTRGAMSFAYGFAAEEAGSYLKLPQGKMLMHNGVQLALVDR